MTWPSIMWVSTLGLTTALGVFSDSLSAVPLVSLGTVLVLMTFFCGDFLLAGPGLELMFMLVVVGNMGCNFGGWLYRELGGWGGNMEPEEVWSTGGPNS